MPRVTPLAPRPPSRLAVAGSPMDFTEAWLANRRLSEHTRAAYRRDVSGWLSWCSLPVSLLAAAAAGLLWRTGLRRYVGAGS